MGINQVAAKSTIPRKSLKIRNKD